MKGFPIKKRKTRKIPPATEIRPHFPKPKVPLRVFWYVHKVDRIYVGWDSQ